MSISRVAYVYALIVIGLIAGVFISAFSTVAHNIYEDVAFFIAPSAGRAFADGERHFDAQEPGQYDIAQAEYFFQKAARLDPSFPYVHHELARIYFLRGDFGGAMTQIDVQIAEHGTSTPNSYYVRGLIEGYMGDYADSAKDYEKFLRFDPHDWAAINDYSWVLLKAGRAKDAAAATAEGLNYFPDNPWLLNTSAIALYESGHAKEARARAQAAVAAGAQLTEREWLHAYPGNDPKIAAEGIAALRQAAADNVHRIDTALAGSAVQ